MNLLLLQVIDALVTTFRALPGVAVIDGPPGQRGSDRIELAVAWSPDDVGGEEGRVETTYEYDEAHEVSVTCLGSAWHGDMDAGPLRSDLQALLDQVEAALIANRTLGGLVTDVRIGPRSLYQAGILDNGGTSASVAFTVDARRA